MEVNDAKAFLHLTKLSSPFRKGKEEGGLGKRKEHAGESEQPLKKYPGKEHVFH